MKVGLGNKFEVLTKCQTFCLPSCAVKSKQLFGKGAYASGLKHFGHAGKVVDAGVEDGDGGI